MVRTLEARLESLGDRLESHLQASGGCHNCRKLPEQDNAAPFSSTTLQSMDRATTLDDQPFNQTSPILDASGQELLGDQQMADRVMSLGEAYQESYGSSPARVKSLTLTRPIGTEILPMDLVLSLADLYFKFVNPWCPILGRQSTFEKLLTAPENDESYRPLLYAIVALSLRFSEDGRITAQYRQRLQQVALQEVLVNAVMKTNIVSLQALLLLSLELSDNGPNLAMLTLVARLVVQLDLGSTLSLGSRVSPASGSLRWSMLPPSQSSFEEEERRRLFWMAYVLDRYAAMIWASPFIINSQEVNAQLPSRYDVFVGNEPMDTTNTPTLTSSSSDAKFGSFSHHCKFLAFGTRVQEFLDNPIDIQSPAEVEKWHMSRWQLDTELNGLVAELPSEHSSTSRLCHSDPTSRISNWIVLHSAIITNIIRLHSPAACPVVTSVAFQASDTATERCLNAVDSAKAVVYDALETDMLNLLGPLFATCLWVSARFLIVHSSYGGRVVIPELQLFNTALNKIGETWQIARRYAESLRRICSEIERLNASATNSIQSNSEVTFDMHPVTNMRR